MCQYDMITHLKEIENTVLIRTLVYSQFPDFPSDGIGIWPLEMRSLLINNLSLSIISRASVFTTALFL